VARTWNKAARCGHKEISCPVERLVDEKEMKNAINM